MGQYHILVNLDKREFVHPHQLGAGLKMWEFTNTRTGPLAALSMLLVSSKSRGGGDCREDNPILGSFALWPKTVPRHSCFYYSTNLASMAGSK